MKAEDAYDFDSLVVQPAADAKKKVKKSSSSSKDKSKSSKTAADGSDDKAERRSSKKRKRAAAEISDDPNAQPAKETVAESESVDKKARKKKAKKGQHGVWIGNLTFATTGAQLREFFNSCGEITRVHLPMQPGHQKPRRNKGYHCLMAA